MNELIGHPIRIWRKASVRDRWLVVATWMLLGGHALAWYLLWPLPQ